MNHAPENISLRQDIYVQIFAVSAAMAGVCLTVIGLVQIVIAVRQSDTIADNLLAADALLFLIACLSSYWVLRARDSERVRRLAHFADTVFIVAMTMMVGICAFIVYAISRY